MSDWSQDAQKKSAGAGDHDAGSPVQPCVENAKVVQVFDANEHTVVQPDLKTPEPAPPLESSVSHEPAAPPVEHQLHVVPGEE